MRERCEILTAVLRVVKISQCLNQIMLLLLLLLLPIAICYIKNDIQFLFILLPYFHQIRRPSTLSNCRFWTELIAQWETCKLCRLFTRPNTLLLTLPPSTNQGSFISVCISDTTQNDLYCLQKVPLLEVNERATSFVNIGTL